VESIAVVPVGLTEHRSRLPRLEAVTPDYARRFLDTMVALQRKTRKRIGYPVVFPSDEFFLIAQLDPPSYSDYPEIPQIENGVGMFSRFHGKFSELCASFPKRVAPPRRIGAITTFMGARVIRRLIEEMNLRIEGLEVDFLTTSNSLFGRDITVTGLLPGADFQRVMQENPGYDRFLVPANSLRPWDNRFLDNMTLEELRASTKAEIAAGGSTAASFVAAALEPLILPA
jgi:NifB/MoaA-like Fe-S oxidoreductase